jgi:CheY-like chemotaxis protein
MELKSGGWHVVEAVNGEAALDLFDTHSIDVLFTDIQLGGRLNGWDVAEAPRAQNPELAVIYSSGKSADTARQVSRGLFFALAEIVDACWLLTDSAKRPSVSLS